MNLTKNKKFTLSFIILSSIVIGILLYKWNSSSSKSVEEYYQHISQPTVTNPNPIVNGYSAYGDQTNYMMPYKTPHFAPVLNGVNLSSTSNIINTSTSNKEMYRYKQEKTPVEPVVASLPSGEYIIKSKNGGILLNSIAFTPVQCNDFLINYKQTPSKEEGWKLHEVSKGIYIFKKPNGKECLYASIGNTLKSYQLEPSCTKKSNVCGLETLDYEDKLDPNSSRTYFEIWKYPEGYAIRSVDNKKFICIKQGKVSFVDSISPDCLFTIN